MKEQTNFEANMEVVKQSAEYLFTPDDRQGALENKVLCALDVLDAPKYALSGALQDAGLPWFLTPLPTRTSVGVLIMGLIYGAGSSKSK